MNPIELQKILSPLVGAPVAGTVAAIAQAHKEKCAYLVTVPSGLIVLLAEKLAEKSVP